MPPFPRALWRTVPVVCLAGSLAMQTADATTYATARPDGSAHGARSVPLSEFDQAERDRRALDAMPEGRRTKLDYERVLDEYRAIYHAHPASSHADASIAAVAELLAAEGRISGSAKTSRDAIAQYEFLRREYPGSKYRVTALMREGEIFSQDLNDREAAQATYQQFLKQYPHSSLAGQVRGEMDATATAPRVVVKKPPVQAAQNRAVPLINKQAAPLVNRHTAPSTSPKIVYFIAEKPSTPLAQKPASPAAARESRGDLLMAPSMASIPAPVSRGQVVTAPAESEHAQAIAQAIPAPTQLQNSAGVDAAAAKTPGKMARVTGVRHWSTTAYTRVAIDLEDEVQFEAGRVTNPDRIFFDLHGTRLAAEMKGKSFDVQDDGFLSKIRIAQFSNDMTRVVLNVSNVSDYSAFLLPNPYRLIIDVHGKPPEGVQAKNSSAQAKTVATTEAPATKPNGQSNVAVAAGTKGRVTIPSLTVAAPVKLTQAQRNGTTRTHDDETPANTQQSVENVASLNAPSGSGRGTKRPTTAPVVVKNVDADDDDDAAEGAPATTGSQPNRAATKTALVTTKTAPATTKTSPRQAGGTMPVPDVAALLDPDAAAAKQGKKKKSGKPSAATAVPDSGTASDGNDLSAMTRVTVPAGGSPTANDSVPSVAAPSGSSRSRKQQPLEPTLTGAHEAMPTAAGERSLVRALGLKIGRIVVDAGHGGHDVGTIGVDGIQEKDVVLDVALRLGKLLKQRLGSDVIYTRDDDTFIPLETRTAIANKAQADLFISVHANSSHDATARGVEVYYLNFTASPDALEVAARENAVSQNSIFQLSSLVKQITLRDKIEESHEFAADVDASLFNGITVGNAGLKDRGVKKAPFVVLIGANMPSILAEISFVTNADDARQLRDPNYRQRIAESLFRGVAKYANGLSGVRLAQNGHGGTNGQ